MKETLLDKGILEKTKKRKKGLGLLCYNPSLGLATKVRVYKGVGQN